MVEIKDMDLAGMTISEKLDILYADAPWMNDNGTLKEGYSKEHGALTSFLNEHRRLILDLLDNHTIPQLTNALFMSTGTFTNWQQHNKEPSNKEERKSKRIRKSRDNSIDKIETFLDRLKREKEDLIKEIDNIKQTLEDIPQMERVLSSIGYTIEQLEILENPVKEIAV